MTDDKRGTQRPLDNDVHHFHDPENMLDISTSDNDGKDVDTELITEVTFIKGLCGNNFSKDSNPRIYYFTLESFAKHHGIPSMTTVLNQCLGERLEEDVVILCNNLREINLVQSALDVMGKASMQYIPYLRNIFPTAKQKQELLDELNSDNDLILLTDYRSFRGCETSHSIILTDFDKPIGANIMAEMLSRTMADLDFVALPKKKNLTSYVNPIETAFDTWKKRGSVQTTTVKFHDEDESSIKFNLHDSCKLNAVEIKIPHSGFILSQNNEDQNSNGSYS